MLLNPKLYEINTRVWIKQFGENASLADVPLSYFEKLAAKGIDIIWLMGIWKTCPDIIDQFCFTNDLTTSYSKCLEDWQRSDVIGSPYSIDEYKINPLIGKIEDLVELKNSLNSMGLKLMLDFVPNHFGAGTRYLQSNPEIFLQADEESFQRDSYTFFKFNDKIFAHGRDPLFPAWTDTVQLNLFNKEAREFLTQIMIGLTDFCDGLRCDMAMLPMNNVFHNTWLGVHNKNNGHKPVEEFWKESIGEVRKNNPEFIFVAEVYWGLEWELQQLGFDFTYDKRLMERLQIKDIAGVKAHLMAEKTFQEKSVRFIENHDEHRAVSAFGKMRSLAAATVMSTITGMKLYYDGQFTAKRVKLALQLSREPIERESVTVTNYYEQLLEITKDKIFRDGKWTLIEPSQVNQSNLTCDNLFIWSWELNKKVRLIVINYSEAKSQCQIKLNFKTSKNKLIFTDLLTDQKYERIVKEIIEQGLYVELKAYQSHIFSVDL